MTMTLTSAAAWLNAVFAGFDEAIMVAVHQLYVLAGDFFTPVMEFISFLGNGGVCLIILSAILIIFKKTRRFGTAMLLGLAIGFLFTNLWLKVVVARPRPYTNEGTVFHELWVIMGQHMESDKSFPSGHTTAAFGCMVPVFILGKKKYSWGALAFAVLMGISRIYLTVHYPSDVLGGIIVGSIAGMVGALIAQKLPRQYYQFPVQKGGKHLC